MNEDRYELSSDDTSSTVWAPVSPGDERQMIVRYTGTIHRARAGAVAHLLNTQRHYESEER